MEIFRVAQFQISSRYVKINSLGETLLYIRRKLDKNWPRTEASNTTHSKYDLCPPVADLKSQLKLPHHWRRGTINQSKSTNWITLCCTEKIERAMLSAKHQHIKAFSPFFYFFRNQLNISLWKPLFCVYSKYYTKEHTRVTWPKIYLLTPKMFFFY